MTNRTTITRQLASSEPQRRRNFVVIRLPHLVYTTVTSTPSVVKHWLFRICRHHVYRIHKGRLVVGLGVQWTPGHRKSPATLQLCVGHQCLVFQLLHAPHAPLKLRRFLSNPNITFVGVSNKNDGALLRCSKHELCVSSTLVDLVDVASEERGYSKKISMEKLAELVVGMEGVKKEEWVGRSDWDEFWLSEHQVEYACLDAFVSFLIGKDLKAWNWMKVDEDCSTSIK
ncbi:uncharacterized protein LOC113777308 [Coffea eugenioides]|uniref:uncharacterized protein LOC113777308 n=1 Tax=Coffea eugenioides TaxID=49369 RepID=UPI000F613E45|nr:uncharacterized protein LOC113777308 [Coffea eugenioides]